MKVKKMVCRICEKKTDKIYKHHLIPKVKGGKNKGIVECCRTCSREIHMLFSENELAKITLEGLLQTEAMKKYLDWIKKRKGDFKVRC